ncbi:unnamed protein product [Arctogadus glacialis]
MADPNERNLHKMAMDVMAMIKTSLGSDNSSNDQGQSRANTGQVQSSGQSRATPSTSSGTPIQRNMSRAFPRMFKNGPRFQRKRPAGKMSQMQFLLLDATLEKTPKPSKEMVLLQAGLGRRTLNIPEASDHQEVQYVTWFYMFVFLGIRLKHGCCVHQDVPNSSPHNYLLNVARKIKLKLSFSYLGLRTVI